MAGIKGKSGRKPNERVFRHALLDKLDQLDESQDRKRIHTIAEKLIAMAEEGDIQAIREVMDRTEGKSIQSVDLSSKDGTMSPTSIERNIVDPKDTNS